MIKYLLTVLLISLLNVDMSFSGDPSSKPVKKVLAFGGNGFIGSEVLNQLFEDPEQFYQVTLVSRGNWYFDSQTRIKPKIHKQIICDRENSDLEYCVDLIKYVNETEKIDVVLDFSSYSPQVLEASLELLNGKVGLYVYISSDSIYEVCRNSKVSRLAYEDDDQRPQSEVERAALNEADGYGNDKLQGEELLRSQDNKIPYIIFRLPDVLGARDTTDRWWSYQLWIQFYNFIKVPLHVPVELRTLKTSYVYVKDVAKAILLSLDKPNTWNNVYNLALDETFTLQEFLAELAKELNIKVDFDVGEFNVFPSVTRGAINTDKAKRDLGFVPTKWETVLKDTVQFYKIAFYQYDSERDDCVHQLTRFVIPRHRKGEFLKFIDELVADPTKTVDSYIESVGGAKDQPGEDVTADQLFEEMMHRTEL